MSRSYREPIYTDGYKGSKRKQYMKRYANHCIRHMDDIPNGNAYRKFTDPWDICDFKFTYNPEPRIYWRNGVPESSKKVTIYYKKKIPVSIINS